MTYVSRLCACLREVLVAEGYEGPAVCEYCAGREKGFHQILDEKRRKELRERRHSGTRPTP